MDELMKLSNATLDKLPETVRLPRYDRADLSAGIVHIGLGNFHRAHQAWYLHRLFDAGLCHDWAILGAGVRPADAAQRERLKQQDYLTTLIELDPSGRSAEICGSMIGFVPVAADNAALIARMSEPDIRIVSLTVTEGGYYIDPAGGGFDAGHPDMVHDARSPDRPKTACGAMIAALRLRRDRGLPAFAGLSCDNLQHNGAILKRTVVELARLSDPALADWITDNSSFPNSMVDCIVPATGPKELDLVRSFGINDASPVTHENFRQWVIEDDFCAGRPDWDKVGATFVADVADYEKMKLRILNGGHQIIAIPGELLGIETIAGAIGNPSIRDFLTKTITEEVAPSVEPVTDMEPLQYLELIKGRFSNSEIHDTTRRVAFDGSSRQTGFLLPSIRDGLNAGLPVNGLALASAMWCRYCEGSRENGTGIEPNDPHWSELNSAAIAARDNPRAWLEQYQYYGDLASDDRFAAAFIGWHEAVSSLGVTGAINSYLTKDSGSGQHTG
jgi:mannitol 2-dehydrogenase